MDHKGTLRLETDRLILRRFEIDDAEDMFNNWASDKDVTKYLTWLPHSSNDITRDIIRSWIIGYEKLHVYNWAIVPKEYGKVIGSITAMGINKKQLRCEIGYCLSKRYWNKGIMTEALNEIIKFFFEEVGFNRIQAKHNYKNPASGKIMQKVGMKYEGRLMQYHLSNIGEFVDCEIYAILRDYYK